MPCGIGQKNTCHHPVAKRNGNLTIVRTMVIMELNNRIVPLRFTCHPPPRLRTAWTRSTPMDRFAVVLHPCADSFQPFHTRLRDSPVRIRTHIQMAVPPLAHNIHQIPNLRPHGFPIRIRGFVSPRIIHCQARLPVPPRFFPRHELLRSRIIPCVSFPEPVVPDDSRLQFQQPDPPA